MSSAPDLDRSAEAALVAAARTGQPEPFRRLTEPHRRALEVHCYRILGSIADAEDVLQETLVRAWQRLDSFEGRSSFRAWLYKIATNACLDALDRRGRERGRLLPTLTHPPADPHAPLASPVADLPWLEPWPDDRLVEPAPGPEARYSGRESVALAFLAALQLLPARQRAVAILRDVLGWSAAETAELLDTTVPAVNSALQRARETLQQHATAPREAPPLPDEDERAVVGRWVNAWDRADVSELVSLLRADAVAAMPPVPTWFQGRDAIVAFVSSTLWAGDAAGRWLLRPTRANGQPAFAVYQRATPGAAPVPTGVLVLRLEGGAVAELTLFGDPALVGRFFAEPPAAPLA